MKKMTFPKNNTVFYIDKLTAKYVYDEIYIKDAYFQNGIEIKDKDIIFDVGANIGLFEKYASEKFKNLQIFTFEPVPQIHACLLKNIENLDSKITALNLGLSDSEREDEINYFPLVSGDSAIDTFDFDRKVQGYLDTYKETVCKTNHFAAIVPVFLRKKVIAWNLKKLYTPQKVKIKLKTLSQIIKEYGIEKIDLLKLDAENHETEVLSGIEKPDWIKIRQISMKVHDHLKNKPDILQNTINLLKINGFKVQIGEHDARAKMGVYMLYAKNTL